MNPLKTILKSGVIPYILIQNLSEEEFSIAKEWCKEIRINCDSVYFYNYYEKGICLRINPWKELKKDIQSISHNTIILAQTTQMREAGQSGLFTIMSLEEFRAKYSDSLQKLVTFPNF